MHLQREGQLGWRCCRRQHPTWWQQNSEFREAFFGGAVGRVEGPHCPAASTGALEDPSASSGQAILERVLMQRCPPELVEGRAVAACSSSLVMACGFHRCLCAVGDDGPQFRIRPQDSMEARQVLPRWRHQGHQSFHQRRRRQGEGLATLWRAP